MIKWLWRQAKIGYRTIFPKQEAKKVIRPEAEKPVFHGDLAKFKTVVLIPGHEKGAKSGAISVKDKNDKRWNERAYWGAVIDEVLKLPNSKIITVETRENGGIWGAYDRADGADLIFELHFNNYNGKAKGVEALHTGKSKWLATEFCDFMCDRFDKVNRGGKDVAKYKRGRYSVLQGAKASKYNLLTEAFFGDNPDDFVEVEPMAQALAEFIDQL